VTARRPKTPGPKALTAALLLALPLAATACGLGGPIRTGQAPTHDWPSRMECPPSVADVCSTKRLSLYGTINEPNGTVYAISSGDDVFVICRYEGVAGSSCARMSPGGERVIGEAGVYRVVDA
jgi:hypothetical protein